MSELLSHEAAHLHIATRQGLFGARADAAEMDIFPFALHGISITCLCADAKGVLIAAGAAGQGLFVTPDGGKSFREAVGSAGLDLRALTCGPEVTYAACGTGTLLKSSDGGRSVTPIPRPPAELATCLASQGSTLFVGSNTCVLASHDAGQTFRPVTCNLPSGILCLSLAGDLLLAGTTRGLWARGVAEQGDWRELLHDPDRRAVTAVAGSSDEPRRIVAGLARHVGIAKPGEPKGADAWLMASDDGGATWRALNNPALPVMRGRITSIVLHPRDPGRLFAGASTGDIYASHDAAHSFGLAASSIPGVNQLAPGPALF